MSSPYAVLGNRPLDQWKVTELKEELKKRKLAVKGLKEELVKRLDEAVRLEQEESASEDTENGTEQSQLPSKEIIAESLASENVNDHIDEVDDQRLVQGQDNDVKVDSVQGQEVILEKEQDAQDAGVEATEVVTETTESLITSSETHIDNDGTDIAGSTGGLENDSLDVQEGSKVESSDTSTELPQANENSTSLPSPPADSRHLQSDQDTKQVNHQVSKVDPDLGFQVVSDSVSTESVSIIEKNELKVDVIADNVKLEVDIKHEKLYTSIKSVDTDGGESHPMDVEEPLDEKDVKAPLDKDNADGTVELKVSVDETGRNDHEVVRDLDPREKLSLDRSSGDDSMEEDVLDIKQVESKPDSSATIGEIGKSERLTLKEEKDVDVVGRDKPVENAENKIANSLTSGKRKFDKEVVVNNETTKKPRRWNVESPKVSEPQGGTSTTPKEPPYLTSNRFSRSDSTLKEETPKERVVPPSSKPPSNSLRIDRFVRPFTLKAVQEFLGKTGTVSSFWMDHIKTHCYVSYSSVEEAVETRNAVYNLQWPPNGGRMLVADFVDPQEVKNRLEAPLPSPATPSPRVQDLRNQIPPHNLPPPPPLANPPTPRDRVVENHTLPARDRLVNLPPPPPVLPEKVETPIVTLDDLFKKTKAMPRIYYLPLSDEQVAGKVKANAN